MEFSSLKYLRLDLFLLHQYQPQPEAESRISLPPARPPQKPNTPLGMAGHPHSLILVEDPRAYPAIGKRTDQNACHSLLQKPFGDLPSWPVSLRTASQISLE